MLLLDVNVLVYAHRAGDRERDGVDYDRQGLRALSGTARSSFARLMFGIEERA